MSEPTTTERLRGLVKTWQRVEPDAEMTALLTELLEHRTASGMTDEERDAMDCLAEHAETCKHTIHDDVLAAAVIRNLLKRNP